MLENKQDEFFAIKGKKGSVTIETTAISVKELRDKNEEGKIQLENYQREYVYNEKKFAKASKVIETILFGKVLPAIIFKIHDKNGAYEIIDGQQRVTSILKFIANEFPLNLANNDDAYMLNGFYYKDLSSTIKSLILNYKLTSMKVVTSNPDIVAEIFLDLNYQPVAVTTNEITTSISYGEISRNAKRFSKIGSGGKFTETPMFWYLFGHQTKYKKDGSFLIPAKDKGGSISLEVFKTMLSFIDKTIVLNKDQNWIRKQMLKSKESDLKTFGLDKFENLTRVIKYAHDEVELNLLFIKFKEQLALNFNNNKD